MRNRRVLRTMLSAGLVAVLAACGSDDEIGSPTASSRPETNFAASVDWRDREVEVTGVDGYDITFCEGEGPFLCVSRGGEWIGGIELASYPGGASSLDDGVDAWVAEHVRAIESDRRAGCDPRYQLDVDTTRRVPFAGRNGYRYGFTGSIDGRPVERVIGAGVVDEGTLHLLVLNALADDGCLAREGELPLEAAEDLAPVLDALAEGTRHLPAMTPPLPRDGEVSGWLRNRSARSIDLDLATLLSGQPAVDAAREDGELPPDGRLPNDFYLDDDDDDVTVVAVSPEVTVRLYDCTAACELRPVDAQAFLLGEVDGFGGKQPLVAVQLRDATVVSIEEIYVP